MIKFGIALLPVFALLGVLFFLDTYKLVKFRFVLFTILIGGLTAAFCLFINSFLLTQLELDLTLFRRYLAPIIEEIFKGIFLVYLIKTKKVGFMVDAAILGFSIGAGFAFFENIHYLLTLNDANLLLWFIRGFGTALMHGGTTAIMGIFSKNLMDRKSTEKIFVFFPGMGIAIIIHSFFNHFILHPLLFTFGILLVLPMVIIFVFERSERSLQKWLDVGFISDIELLMMIQSGTVLESRIGQYLLSLKKKIPGEVLVDMLCYLQLSVELALKAKGLLLMNEAGFKTTPEKEIKNKLKELKNLEGNIGKTGKRILAPFLHIRSQDLWQIHMLERFSLNSGFRLFKK